MAITRILALHARVQWADPLANAKWLCAQLRQCARLKPDLVVTPELALTGHPMLTQGLPWAPAETRAAVGMVARAADDLGLRVLLGTLHFSAEQLDPSNALILLADGRQTLVCEKHKQSTLPAGHALSEDYRYGTTREAFQVAGLQCAPLICAESVDPAIVADVKALHPGLVVHPSAWGAADGEVYAYTAASESLFQEELVLVVNQTGGYLGEWPYAETFLYHRGKPLAIVKSDRAHWLLADLQSDSASGATRCLQWQALGI